MLRILADTLAAAGYTVTPALGARQLLAALDTQDFALVILPSFYREPQTAAEITADIRLRHPETQIIICSGFPRYYLPQKLGQGISYDGFLSKPFRLGELLKILRKALPKI